jgi:hypothetical protein
LYRELKNKIHEPPSYKAVTWRRLTHLKSRKASRLT